MKGRLPILLMSLLALALALSLVATLAPDAGAQNSGTAPDGPATWMRYNIPAAPDLQVGCCPNGFLGVTLKNCCIRVTPGSQPGPDAVIGSESAASSNPYSSFSRWFCMGFITP
jgi:hypothetical protein